MFLSVTAVATSKNKQECELSLISKIRSGDSDSFNTFFLSYYSRLFGFAMRYMKDPMLAEDIVQDLFAYLWENRVALEIKNSLSSYLFTSVRNRCLNQLKRMKIELTIEDGELALYEAKDNFQDEDIDHLDFIQAVEKAIEKLPGRCRLIFLMNRKDELKYSEISEILGISLNTVTTQMAIALKKLRKSLAAYRNY